MIGLLFWLVSLPLRVNVEAYPGIAVIWGLGWRLSLFSAGNEQLDGERPRWQKDRLVRRHLNQLESVFVYSSPRLLSWKERNVSGRLSWLPENLGFICFCFDKKASKIRCSLKRAHHQNDLSCWFSCGPGCRPFCCKAPTGVDLHLQLKSLPSPFLKPQCPTLLSGVPQTGPNPCNAAAPVCLPHQSSCRSFHSFVKISPPFKTLCHEPPSCCFVPQTMPRLRERLLFAVVSF